MLVFFTLKFKKVFHHLSAWAHHVIGDAAVLQKILTSHLVQEICLPWNSSSGNSRFKLKGLKPCGHWNLQRSSKYEKHMVTIMIQLTFAVRLGWHHHLLLKYDRSCFFSRHTYCMSTRFISILHNVCTCVYCNIFFQRNKSLVFFPEFKMVRRLSFIQAKPAFWTLDRPPCAASKLFTLPALKEWFCPLKKADHLLAASFLRV